mgnify:CR=1 FL=1
MDHQDWKPVVLRNPTAVKKNLPKETVKRVQHTGVKDVDMDENRIKMVSPQLKRAFEQARLNSRDPQTGRCYTHDRLAKLINGDPKVIKQLETGKLSEKEAKQVALKVERALKIKILGESSTHP